MRCFGIDPFMIINSELIIIWTTERSIVDHVTIQLLDDVVRTYWVDALFFHFQGWVFQHNFIWGSGYLIVDFIVIGGFIIVFVFCMQNLLYFVSDGASWSWPNGLLLFGLSNWVVVMVARLITQLAVLPIRLDGHNIGVDYLKYFIMLQFWARVLKGKDGNGVVDQLGWQHS